jgi:hypothetical protein
MKRTLAAALFVTLLLGLSAPVAVADTAANDNPPPITSQWA